MTAPRPAPPANRLLAGLPPAEYRRLVPLMEPVPLPFRLVLYPPGGPVGHVYLPSRGVVTTVAVMADRRTIEVGLCGREGGSRGGGRPGRPDVGLPGHGAGGRGRGADGSRRVPGAAGPGRPLHRVLARYRAAYLTQTAQSAACNGLHSIPHRCARRLLMTRDRTDADESGLTHEFLGTMLGVRRASVTDILRPFQVAGLNECHRGRMTVRDRPGLEAAACECYRFVRRQFDRLLP